MLQWVIVQWVKVQWVMVLWVMVQWVKVSGTGHHFSLMIIRAELTKRSLLPPSSMLVSRTI
jgi:acid stress-induced BolA-like protein IbaG/YrbA